MKNRNYSFYLSERNFKRVEAFKEKYNCKTNSEVMKKMLDLIESIEDTETQNSTNEKLTHMDKEIQIQTELLEMIANHLQVDPYIHKDKRLFDYYQKSKDNVEENLRLKKINIGRRQLNI